MLAGKVNTRQTARTLTIPAPIGGLNGRDSLAAMPPKDAFLLDNWVPGTATVDSRNGNEPHVNDIGTDPVESLVAYNGGADKVLLAFAGDSIWDATVPSPPDGPEIVGDPSFNTPAYWAVSGAGNSVAGGKANWGGTSGFIWKTGGAGVVAGLTYKITYTIDVATSGSMRVYLGNGPTNFGAVRSTVGTFIDIVTAPAAPPEWGMVSSSFVGSVIEFSIVEVPAPPVALQTGRSSARMITTMFSNAGAQFLVGVSGLDVAISFDGTTVTNLVLTGMTGSAATLSHVFGYKGRLYWAQKDQLGFYYLPVGQIQGALSYFDLSQIARKGGYLVAMASFSADSGNGPNDYAVFITSLGEYIVYAGYDPSAAANWELVGRYYSAPPIGRDCTINYGSDLVILTLEGAIPFSAIRREGGIVEDDAITYKLGRYLQEKNIYADVFGWQAVQYPRAGMLIVNVPDSSSIAGGYVQFVQNTTTKAWTRFTNLNGVCWCVFDGRLYFGKYDGRVMLADEGKLDDGVPIQLDCKQAYNYFDDGYGSGPSNKHFHFAKMLMGCDGTPPLNAQFNVDYMEDQPEFIATPADDSGSPWDTTDWDLGDWGSDVTTQFIMFSIGRYGVAGSLWLRASLEGLSLKWYATQYIFSKAAGVL